MFKLMKERNELLRNKLNGVSIEEKKYEGNKNIIEAFDDLMEKIIKLKMKNKEKFMKKNKIKLMNGMQKLNNKMKI